MRRTKIEAEATRQSLLRTALEVMVERGYSDATLEDIARRAGLTRGAIYWHFEGKEQLYRELADRMQAVISGVIERALAVEGGALARARNLTGSILENFFTNSQFRRYVELTWFRMEGESLAADRSREANRRVIAELERLIAQAKSRRQIRAEVDVSNAALQITCLISGIYRLAILLGPKEIDLQRALSVADAWWNGIERLPPVPDS